MIVRAAGAAGCAVPIYRVVYFRFCELTFSENQAPVSENKPLFLKTKYPITKPKIPGDE
jgi:hypothetical protein